jgi:hypothetical protein
LDRPISSDYKKSAGLANPEQKRVIASPMAAKRLTA